MTTVWRIAAAIGSLGCGLVLAGCGSHGIGTAPAQSVLVDERATHDEKVCPVRLPAGEDSGLPTEEHATTRPSLLTPQAGWICRYFPIQGQQQPRGGGRHPFVLKRQGKPHRVDPTRLASISRYLTQLTPPPNDRACTGDLGTSWMLVYAHAGDLTGVEVEDYACRDIHLTDEPFTTAPGGPGQVGTVPGALTAPARLLDEIKASYSN